ncbi:MAG: Ldh family oxidoreductase [Rhodobacter sp.]|nr:Ldh family oxidoreductase [Paracoccaceae bacterium]MCC0077274.1 Ldh family oxidoreductase [Rhodobacter sp.]
MNTHAKPTFSPAQIRTQTLAILRGWGMEGDDAEATADALLDCDLRGIDTHGISLLALYAGWIAGGGFNLAARAELLREGPNTALFDAHGGLGFAVSVRAAELAADKARERGVAVVTVRNSHHFGAAGYYARIAARRGVVSLVATSTKVVCVVPPGASEPVLGTNPLAYGVPRASGEPIVFDMATSTAAGNKVRLHQLTGTPVPEGWVVDGHGQPVTDPEAASNLVYNRGQGGLTPLGATPVLGAHKGYGLALLVHFLGGTLAGGRFAGSRNPDHPQGEGDNIGHFFMAIDPAAFRDMGDFLGDVADVESSLRATPTADPTRPVLLPGDIEEGILRERTANGVPLAPNLVTRLRDIASDLGVPFVLDGTTASAAAALSENRKPVED